MADQNYEALFEREKWRKKKLQNDIAEGTALPLTLLVDSSVKSGRQVIAILETIPLMVKRYWPEVKGDQVFLMKRTIIECRNIIADINLNDELP